MKIVQGLSIHNVHQWRGLPTGTSWLPKVRYPFFSPLNLTWNSEIEWKRRCNGESNSFIDTFLVDRIHTSVSRTKARQQGSSLNSSMLLSAIWLCVLVAIGGVTHTRVASPTCPTSLASVFLRHCGIRHPPPNDQPTPQVQGKPHRWILVIDVIYMFQNNSFLTCRFSRIFNANSDEK